MRERCFRTVLSSPIGAPASSSRRVTASLSSRVIPSGGAVSSAEPPPEIRTKTRSRSPARRAIARTSSAAATLAASGSGCPASTTRTRDVGAVCPYLTLTTPALIRAPRISSGAAAIAAPALPPPTTKMPAKRFRSGASPKTTSRWPSSVRARRIAPRGSAPCSAASRHRAAARRRGAGAPCWKNASGSRRIREDGFPQRTSSIRPDCLHARRPDALPLQRPAHHVPGQRRKAVHFSHVEEKDGLRLPAPRRPDCSPCRALVGEMARGTEDAVLQKPGVPADAEQPRVVVGLEQDHVRRGQALPQCPVYVPQIVGHHHLQAVHAQRETYRFDGVVRDEKRLDGEGADVERGPGGEALCGGGAEEVRRLLQRVFVGQDGNARRAGQGPNAARVVVVFVGQ